MIKIYTIVLTLIAVFLLGLTFSSRFKDNSQKNQKAQYSYKNITPQEFDKILSTRKVFLVDVHIPEQQHLDGTNLVVPYNKIKENLNKFPRDKNTEIIVYCRSGRMSTEAAKTLSQAGYTHVYNLVGGVNAYHESHYGVFISPITKDLGKVIYGDIAKTSFTLTNNTKEKISITKVATSCSCTSAEVAKKELKSYETTQVLVSFNPAVHKDNTDLGDIIRTIYVDTTSSNFSRVEASITAKVIKKSNN
ncbi:MAG: DUF1573 domain-containing protein [Patescibacteria group bacterium]|nr:DUF1573 domain-containing protein [Patescibacteria group bacterium]